MPHRILPLVVVLLVPAAGLRADDSPLPPREAPRHMTLPDGFQATLFAGEPDVVQPIAFTLDDRGRLWVVECYSYPDWQTDGGEGKDRVLIFEDRTGDGRFDTRKVFWDKGTNLSGIEVGFGGVWLCAAPHLLYLPIREGEDVPDGPPQVLLDGWSLETKHNVFNGLTWGPDGWLYGCHGILATSQIGKPGTPDEDRVPLNCGVWRYHPTRHVFEVVAWGTTNPWGLDFDDYGRMFITNCVIEHLFYVVPGAHFKRMHGQDLDPHVYGLMESCADHIHWGGGRWQDSRGGEGEHDRPGGGHAHAGAMIYLGDNWPDPYRNGLFTCNVHGHRVNHDLLERQGSGYVARHRPDFLQAGDTWFRGLELKYGPDGGVYLTDWADTGECHDYKDVHRQYGRIYKITHGDVSSPQVDVARLSDPELVELQLHKNDWYVRHARRVLQERAAAGQLATGTRSVLWNLLQEQSDVTRKLRALWALHVTGGLAAERAASLLKSPHAEIRSWTVQLELESPNVSAQTLARLAELAEDDPSPVVRLALAAGLQRLPLDRRRPIAEALVVHEQDADDANLPLMVWYGIEPLIAAAPDRASELIEKAEIPLVRRHSARRLAAASKLDPLVALLGRADENPRLQRDLLGGIHEAIRGRREMPMPEGWPAVSAKLIQSPRTDVRKTAQVLAVIFGDSQAIRSLREIMMNTSAPPAERENALEASVQKRDRTLLPLLYKLIDEPEMCGPALRGLAAFDDQEIPGVILRQYTSLTDAGKQDAISTLASRASSALALLDAVERGRIPRGDLSAYTVRQLSELDDGRINAKVEQVWGAVRPTAEDKQALIAKYKETLAAETMQEADLSHGRLVFSRTCASCHRLFDDGREVGPELTGSQRANLDYVLENLLDPSAVVSRDFQMTVIVTIDGRVVTGIVKQEDDETVTIATANDDVTVPKNEIDERNRSPVSMMPEGLLNELNEQELRDLIAYLASPDQVPLPADKQ